MNEFQVNDMTEEMNKKYISNRKMFSENLKLDISIGILQ